MIYHKGLVFLAPSFSLYRKTYYAQLSISSQVGFSIISYGATVRFIYMSNWRMSRAVSKFVLLV